MFSLHHLLNQAFTCRLEHGFEEDMHDQVTREAEQNEIEPSKEEMEDDVTGAAVEIRRPRDETTDPKD